MATDLLSTLDSDSPIDMLIGSTKTELARRSAGSQSALWLFEEMVTAQGRGGSKSSLGSYSDS